MSKLSARNKITLPVIADGPASIEKVFDDAMVVMDKFSQFDTGTLAARPVSTAGVPGRLGRRYLATDDVTAGPNGTEYIDTGTAWIAAPSVVPALSITNGKLADDSVDERVLGPASVGTAEMIDGAVSTGKLAAKAVDATKIADVLKPSATAVAATEALRALGNAAGNAAAGLSPTISGKVTLPDQGNAGGILIGGDAALYRGAANVLTTPGTLNAVTGLQINGAALASTHLSDSALLARLASPTFTGVPAAPTPAVDTNTTQIATTAFVLGQASSSAPLAAGTASAGVSTRWTRGDHVHPTDVTRAPLASPTFTGTVTTPAEIINSGGKTALSLADTGAQLSGLTIGGDTNLYRSGVGALATDTDLYVRRTGASQVILGTIGGLAGLAFGSASDVTIQRDASARLKFISSIAADAGLQIRNSSATGFSGVQFNDNNDNGVSFLGLSNPVPQYLRINSATPIRLMYSGAVRIETDVNGIGFYGVTPIAKPGATNDLKASLVSLGLLTGGGGTSLDLTGGALTAAGVTNSGTLTHSGSSVGFYGATPVAKAGATNDLKASLVSLGLITGAGATPLNLNGGALTSGAIVASGTLGVSGGASLSTGLAVAGAFAPASGQSVEIGVLAGVGYNQSYNRTSSAFQPLQLIGSSVDIQYGTGTPVSRLKVDVNGIGFFNATPVARSTGWTTGGAYIQTKDASTSDNVLRTLIDTLKANGFLA